MGKTLNAKDLELLQEKFRKIFVESINDQSKNRTDVRTYENKDTDNFSRILEAIEYNRATAELGANFAIAFTALGLITLCINLIILSIILFHRHRVLRQVFYILIINFAIIDCLKGVCLASHALRFITPPSEFEDRKVLATRIDQYVVIFFRLFNLATVFNLLMITLNEFIYIKFPLRYHQWIRRRLVVCLVCVAWIISIVFTVCSSLAKTKDDTIFVSLEANGTTPPRDGTEISYNSRSLLRSASDALDLHTVFTFALTGFCLFSLLVVLICYAVFFNVIRNIQKHDRQLFSDANLRRTSEASVECADMQHFDDRKIKRQLLKRYKYVLVIGSVILVYMLYLISYSSIQILQYFNLSRAGMSAEKMRTMVMTRLVLVLLCGLHSAIQPICYFRMREFRGIVIRLFGYSCRVGRNQYMESERSEHANSYVDVTPLATTCQTPQCVVSSARYCKYAPHFNAEQNQLNGEQTKIPSSLRQKSPVKFMNGVRAGRKQSVVHFEEGNMLVSTLSRREPGFINENEIL